MALRLCEKNCGRPAFMSFSTCCVRCTGDPDSGHNYDCAAKAEQARAAAAEAEKQAALEAEAAAKRLMERKRAYEDDDDGAVHEDEAYGTTEAGWVESKDQWGRRCYENKETNVRQYARPVAPHPMYAATSKGFPEYDEDDYPDDNCFRLSAENCASELLATWIQDNDFATATFSCQGPTMAALEWFDWTSQPGLLIFGPSSKPLLYTQLSQSLLPSALNTTFRVIEDSWCQYSCSFQKRTSGAKLECIFQQHHLHDDIIHAWDVYGCGSDNVGSDAHTFLRYIQFDPFALKEDFDMYLAAFNEDRSRSGISPPASIEHLHETIQQEARDRWASFEAKFAPQMETLTGVLGDISGVVDEINAATKRGDKDAAYALVPSLNKHLSTIRHSNSLRISHPPRRA